MSEKLTVGELVYKISGDMDNLRTELKRSDTEIKKLKETMEKTSKATGVTATSFLKGSIVISLWNKAVQLAKGLLISTIKNASDLTESVNAVNVVFKDGADRILDYGKNAANSVGLAASEYNQLATITGALLKDSGKSMNEVADITNDLTVRAADMASVFNTDVKDALSAINQALRGETEAIRRYAGDVTDATLQTFLNSQGIKENVKDLTEQEKRLRRVDLIMHQTSDTAGDFANTSDSLANQQRILAARFKDTTARIGTALLPSLNHLGKAFIKNDGQTKDNTESMDTFGRVVFRFTNLVVVLGATISNLGNATKIAWNGLQNAFIGGGAVVLKAMQLVMKGLGKDTETIDGAISSLADQATKNFEDMGDAIDNMKENSETISEALAQVFDPSSYDTLKDKLAGEKVALEQADQAAQDLEQALIDEEAAAKSAAEAAAELEQETEGVTNSLISLRDEAIKTGQALNEELSDSFKKFSNDIKGNFQESAQSLAGIVINAEAEIERLRKSKKDDDLNKDEQKAIKAEIKKQKAILKTSKDFEERQAARIEAIRNQLQERGIDAAKAGLDNLLNVRSLEEEIEEQRRFASLNEFEQFEEKQSEKLLMLADAFISEATLLQNKIDTQKGIEDDLTKFLLSEDLKRIKNTETWANQTIAKYGEVANSLKSLITAESQLNSIRANASVSPSAPSLPAVNPVNSSTVNNNRSTNITAPVNITGSNVQNLSANEISAILGYELTKYIRN